MHPRFQPADRVLRRLLVGGLLLSVAGLAAEAAQEVPPHSAALDRMIIEQAKKNGVPEKLVRRIVMRESKYDPAARNHKYWGLMQISYPTAKSMGFKGTPQQLLNPLVNLTYAVPYLANAFVIAGKHEDEAVRLYAAGYYFTARRRGLLGALRTAESDPLNGVPDDASTVVATAAPPPQPSYGIFGALIGIPTQPPEPQPQQVAEAAPQAPAPQAAPTAMDKAAESTAVEMVADKAGTMAPPKKWRRDGGVSVIARGDQGIENDAAYVAANDTGPERKSAHHSHKTTTFAALDPAPPSSAKAYASGEGQDPRFAQAASQAAIFQATQGAQAQPAPFQAAAAQPDPSQQPAVQTAAADQPAAPSADVQPRAKRKVERHSRHHGSDNGATEVAKSDGGADDAKPRKHAARHVKAASDAPVVAAQQADDGSALRQ